VYGTSNVVSYCMDSTLQRLRAVCAATARLLLLLLLSPTAFESGVTPNYFFWGGGGEIFLLQKGPRTGRVLGSEPLPTS